VPKLRKSRKSQWQQVKKPGPGEGNVIGYVRYSSINQDPRSIAEQKVRIEQKVAAYGWRVARFAEEPEESASYDDLESRPVEGVSPENSPGKICQAAETGVNVTV
jgi:Resolvase, N terminal domain